MPTYKHRPTVTMTMVVNSVCSKCGTIGKSGKLSCCGRGGSWFRTCGSGGNSNLAHTWSEGIRACKPREQLIGVQNSSFDSYTDPSPNPKTVTTAAKTATGTSKLISTYVHTSMPTTPPHTSENASSTGKIWTQVLGVVLHMNILFVV